MAVVSVLLFHVDIRPFSGGYVGVDIFFVISGFLISTIIARELNAGSFSILRFYERRIRRIFPALFAVIGATILAGSYLLLPIDYRALGASAVSTTLFMSNVYFANQSGYFGNSAEEAPLLHTWSLAVEEQYYIVFPLLMLFAFHRCGGRYRALFAPLAMLSFVAGLLQVTAAPTHAFYLPMSRAWEFLGGALLGTGAVPHFQTQRRRLIAGLLGAALILWSVSRFSDATVFPGANALFPVLGAMLVIHSGGAGSIVARLLATRVPSFIGRISYSLYLWHWPIIVFWKYRTDGTWQPWEQTTVIAAALLIATLSWRYIEQPFRRPSPAGPRPTFRFAGAMLAAGCAVGGVLYLADGFPSRMTPTVVALGAATREMAYLPERCSGTKPVRRRMLCSVGARRDALPSFLLWGDSHAHALIPAFDRAGTELGLVGRIASYPACPALLGLDRLDQPPSHDCSEFNRLVIEALKGMPSVTTVVLVSRWGLCANGTRTEGGRPCYLGRDGGQAKTFANDRLLFTQGLAATIATLTKMGRKVILVAPTPEFRSNVPETLARSALFGGPSGLALSQRDYMRRERAVLDDFAAMQSRFAVRIVYPHQVLCRTGDCLTIAGGTPLYSDDDHLSKQGSLMLTDAIYDALKASKHSVAGS